MTKIQSEQLQDRITSFMDAFFTPFTLTDEGKSEIAQDINDMICEMESHAGNDMLKDLRVHA